jgi:hypothetical protein
MTTGEPPRGGASRATSGPGDDPEDARGGTVRIGAVSGYGARTRLPYVDVTFEEAGRPELRYQISPEEARRVALILLECAEAADQDANLVRFLTGTVGVDLAQAAQVLQEFRQLRSLRHEAEAQGGAGT